MILRFVTGNSGKVAEAQAILAPRGIRVEAAPAHVVEIQADALDEVARAKADQARRHVARPFIVEDAGLFIHALKGFPGVYSAPVYKMLGNEGVLRLLEGVEDRSAHFEAVVAYVDGDGPARLFRGRVDGVITERAQGSGGFGFDPIFTPQGGGGTFAQLDREAKSRASHRGQALRALAGALEPARKG